MDISEVPKGNIIGPSYSLAMYTADVFSILENRRVGYADDST